VADDKMMLGRINGGAVRLAHAGPKMIVGEGLETCCRSRRPRAYRPGRCFRRRTSWVWCCPHYRSRPRW
jgi:hypothetical protein